MNYLPFSIDLSGDAMSRDLEMLLYSLLLITARLQGFFYLSPIFNRNSMQRLVRLGFVLAIGMVLLPAVYAEAKLDNADTLNLIPLALKEFLIGLMLGALVWMPIRGLELTGAILDMQRGNMQGMALDPVISGQSTTTSILLLQIFTGYFFAVGGLQMVQETLYRSFDLWPVWVVLPSFGPAESIALIGLAGSLFISAFLFALPISALMVIADLGISFMAKSAPTLNALTMGMPIKTFILLIMLFFYLEFAFPRLLDSLFTSLDDLVRILSER